MNTQKPEARRDGDGSSLDFHSMFFTIQGEGPFTGHRSIFVRLAGCNLQCPGCDTEYTEGRADVSAYDIADLVVHMAGDNNARRCLVVITGGEPLRQNLGTLIGALLGRGHPVQIETNGVFRPDAWTLHYVLAGQITLVVSPKTSRINIDTAHAATCFKYVLDHRSVNPVDGLPMLALEHPAKGGVARPVLGKPVYLNPFDSGDAALNEQNLFAAANSAKEHGYILGVQLHKLAGLA